MIKIKPFFLTDTAQVRALLRHQDGPVPYESFCQEEKIFDAGFTFWQHWLPCNWHLGPSVYVAKDDGVVLGLISLDATGKSNNCWHIDHLVVHPQHRGRGIAQELIRYVLAQFGSQGINHFTAEVSDQNSAGLSLLGSCGFRRLTRLTYYQVPIDFQENADPEVLKSFRLARPGDQNNLFQLHQSVLPSDIRRVYDFVAEDYQVPELNIESLEKMTRKLLKHRTWYWVVEENGRDVIPCAAKVSAHREGDFHIEFLVNQGFEHLADAVVEFVLTMMRKAGMKGMVVIKVYDFQKALIEALDRAGLDRVGSFSLVGREHWLRAKRPRLSIDQAVTIPPLGRPAINIPFISPEYRVLEGFDEDGA
ncbi:MAG: GNAT family N-acetyltransferase [Candidatus Melainabacteria bacterium]|nr:GNAT family N-acetyltransferase [Candidatus Melainabacteria bacterium]